MFSCGKSECSINNKCTCEDKKQRKKRKVDEISSEIKQKYDQYMQELDKKRSAIDQLERSIRADQEEAKELQLKLLDNTERIKTKTKCLNDMYTSVLK
jgi:DNA repair exonuclease SbcCD ATPase subunit